jgi:hypothetical protein
MHLAYAAISGLTGIAHILRFERFDDWAAKRPLVPPPERPS